MWVMLPRLEAEEELVARGVAVHPHLEPADQRSIYRSLRARLGLKPQKATKADLRGMKIRVKE